VGVSTDGRAQPARAAATMPTRPTSSWLNRRMRCRDHPLADAAQPFQRTPRITARSHDAAWAPSSAGQPQIFPSGHQSSEWSAFWLVRIRHQVPSTSRGSRKRGTSRLPSTVQASCPRAEARASAPSCPASAARAPVRSRPAAVNHPRARPVRMVAERRRPPAPTSTGRLLEACVTVAAAGHQRRSLSELPLGSH
jgi:hypothetical protein